MHQLRGVEEDLYEAKRRAFGIARDDGRAGAYKSNDEVYVEIAPGVKAALRRTKETVDAIARDFFAPASCFACSTDLFCIADVKYIICPQCKTISPAEAASSVAGAFNGNTMPRYGVGLGFTYDTLFQMQSKVVRERKLPAS